MRLRLLAVVVLFAPVLLVSPAHAQLYIGGYLTGIPSSKHDVKAERTFLTTGTTDKFTAEDAKFSSSIVYGGLVGYQFLPFLAVEADIYHLNPGLEAQSKVVHSPTAGDFVVTTKSGDVHMTVFALEAIGSFRLLPSNTVPDGRLQLYGGAGLAAFLSSVDSEGSTANATLDVRDHDVSFGPQVKVGTRWFFTRNLGAFVEGRYAHTTLHVEDTGVTNSGAPLRLKLRTTVDLPLVLVGISWHFR